MAKGGANGYAALSKQRASGKTKRRKLDDYETPEAHSHTLFRYYTFKARKAFEPAAGSGRMARVIKAHIPGVVTSDIKSGKNFLARTAPFPGAVITNPPYRDGLADAFVKHGLKIADGEVAMLMESKFLYGSKRAADLYNELGCKPAMVIHIPERIYFFQGSGKDAKQLESQFFNHVWIVWPDRATRAKGKYQTVTVWAEPAAGEFE